MAEDCGSSSVPCSPEEQLALAIGTTKALAEYARAEHLTQADELLTGFIAFLVTRSTTGHQTD